MRQDDDDDGEGEADKRSIYPPAEKRGDGRSTEAAQPEDGPRRCWQDALPDSQRHGRCVALLRKAQPKDGRTNIPASDEQAAPLDEDEKGNGRNPRPPEGRQEQTET